MSLLNLQGTSSFHTLEITVLSCEDLRIHGRSVNKNTYVVVRTDLLNFRETTTDTEGGSHPSWDQKLVLDMSMRETFITLEVHGRTLCVDRIIGSARMPVNDFIGGYFPEDYLNFLSYRLKDSKGLENGIINVSMRLRVPEYLARKKKVIVPSTSQPALALALLDGKNYDGVVTGIPVLNTKFT